MSHHDRDLVACWLRRCPEEDIVEFNKDTYGDRIEAGAPNQTIEDAVNRIMDKGPYQLKLVGRDYEVVPTSASAGAGTTCTAPRVATLTPMPIHQPSCQPQPWPQPPLPLLPLLLLSTTRDVLPRNTMGRAI